MNSEQTKPTNVGSNDGLGVLPERAAIIARARKLRAEIAQTFADAEHWNRVHVPWKGKPIDPDPDGQLGRILASIDRMLAAEQK